MKVFPDSATNSYAADRIVSNRCLFIGDQPIACLVTHWCRNDLLSFLARLSKKNPLRQRVTPNASLRHTSPLEGKLECLHDVVQRSNRYSPTIAYTLRSYYLSNMQCSAFRPSISLASMRRAKRTPAEPQIPPAKPRTEPQITWSNEDDRIMGECLRDTQR